LEELFFPIREAENFEHHMVVVEVLVEVASSLAAMPCHP
jgi:hypothetical protein